jgi:succinate dehydrogenase subunit C
MSQTPMYSEHHPKWYRRRVSTYWWTSQWSYFKFILRELTSLAVAYFVVIMLLQLGALNRGPEAYARFQTWLKSPVAIVLNVVALLLLLFHTITWFNLTPRAMPVRFRGKRLPDWMIAAPNYVAWLVISAIITWFIVRK